MPVPLRPAPPPSSGSRQAPPPSRAWAGPTLSFSLGAKVSFDTEPRKIRATVSPHLGVLDALTPSCLFPPLANKCPLSLGTCALTARPKSRVVLVPPHPTVHVSFYFCNPLFPRVTLIVNGLRSASDQTLFTWLHKVFSFLSLGGLPFNVLQRCCMECALGGGCGLVQSVEARETEGQRPRPKSILVTCKGAFTCPHCL